MRNPRTPPAPVVCLLLLAACAAPVDDTSAASLDEAFQSAATAYDVPRDLLVAIAWSLTRFEDGEEGDH